MLLLASLPGCGTSPLPDPVERVEPWSDAPRGRVLVTRHFAIHSTLDDPRRNRELAATLEAAIVRFEALTGLSTTPATHASGGSEGRESPPERWSVMVFATRREWESYTRRQQPDLAAGYLRIRRGGYTIGERSVLYDIGRGSTLGVAVHEAWHQFCSRYFRRRLPPTLEEGLASRFDHVRLVQGRVELVESPSPARLEAVRDLLRENRAVPIRVLLSMHAGDVLGTSRGRVEAFYAQSWALAEFLLRGDGGRHAESLRRMFSDLASGPEGDASWTPGQSVELFAGYFGDPDRLEPSFRRFLVGLTR